LGLILGITGTPGTGKKSIAPAVSALLGLPCVAINDLVSPPERRGRGRRSIDVEPRTLRRRLLQLKGRKVVYGHLLPDILEGEDVDRVVVLRCDPDVLKNRLVERGYSWSKVSANVEAELIGLISSSAVAEFGRAKVTEVDTTKSDVAKTTVKVARFLSHSTGTTRRIDWLGDYASEVKLRSLLSKRRARSPRT
jgi:adenylate kinase